MLYRYTFSIVFMVLSLSDAHAERSLARVIDVQRGEVDSVVLDAGRLDGLSEGAQVTLLREGEAIVHPLSGEVLGIPQEPVGLVEVQALQDHRAQAVLLKSYSTPRVGDLAEYAKVAVEPEEASGGVEVEQVNKMMNRVEVLEAGMQQYRKSQKSLSAYPVFAQQVWDEMGTIKSYLVTLDERLIELEAQQGEDRNRLAAMIDGEYQSESARELTIRYSEDTDLKLRVAGKTLEISVERDSILLKESNEFDRAVNEPNEGGWELDEEIFGSPYVIGGIVFVVLLVVVVLVVIIKQRFDRAMDGLEEYDEDLMVDEDEEEEDFDNFEEEYEKR
jgi:hypothetical protein